MAQAGHVKTPVSYHKNMVIRSPGYFWSVTFHVQQVAGSSVSDNSVQPANPLVATIEERLHLVLSEGLTLSDPTEYMKDH